MRVKIFRGTEHGGIEDAINKWLACADSSYFDVEHIDQTESQSVGGDWSITVSIWYEEAPAEQMTTAGTESEAEVTGSPELVESHSTG